MRQLLLLLMVLFIAGCAHSGIDLQPNEKLSTQSYSIVITDDGWWTGQKPEERMLKFQGTSDRLWFSRHLPNMMSENVSIMVRVPPENQNVNFLLDKKKNDDLERTRSLPPSEWEKKNIAERGVAYNKHYVDFIGGLKCTSNAESSSPALGVGFKKYYTVCGYYDINGNKKRIDIMYHYVSSFNGTKFQSDATSTIASGKDIDTLFKQDMKAIFDSLVIHDIDRAKMQNEGLLHDKKYEIQEW